MKEKIKQSLNAAEIVRRRKGPGRATTRWKKVLRLVDLDYTQPAEVQAARAFA